MALDITGISYFAPLIAFLIVTFITSAVLFVTKILGENKWVQVFVSLFVATLFVSAAGAVDFVVKIVPWFAVLLVMLFFIMVLVGGFGLKSEWLGSWIGKAFLVLLGIGFLVVGYIAFNSYLQTSDIDFVRDWLFSTSVIGGIVLLIISGIAAWILVKAK